MTLLSAPGPTGVSFLFFVSDIMGSRFQTTSSFAPRGERCFVGKIETGGLGGGVKTRLGGLLLMRGSVEKCKKRKKNLVIYKNAGFPQDCLNFVSSGGKLGPEGFSKLLNPRISNLINPPHSLSPPLLIVSHTLTHPSFSSPFFLFYTNEASKEEEENSAAKNIRLKKPGRHPTTPFFF